MNVEVSGCRYRLATYRDLIGKMRVDLVDGTGLFVDPWITSLLRNHSGKFNTILDNGYQLIFLLDTCESQGIDIVERVESGELLTSDELRYLLHLLKKKAEPGRFTQSNVTQIAQFKGKALSNLIYGTFISESRISGPTIKKRISALISLIEWIYTKVHNNGISTPPYELHRRYKWLTTELKRSRKAIKKDNTVVKGAMESVIPDQKFFRMMAIARPNDLCNPWTPKNRLRNHTIICLLNETGIRRGEAAGIKVTDLRDGVVPQIEITDILDDPTDTRKRPPSTKTIARLVTVSRDLMEQIKQYVELDRVRYAQCKGHEFLFVSHQGKTAGNPLDNQSINNIFIRLCKVAELPSLAPHKFRHKYNEVFDEKARKRGYTKAQRDDMRRTACGWSRDSLMVDYYNDFCLAQETAEIKKTMQQGAVPAISIGGESNDA